MLESTAAPPLPTMTRLLLFSSRQFAGYARKGTAHFPGSCLECSHFSTAQKYEKFSRKVRISCCFPKVQAKVGKLKPERTFHLLSTHADWSGTSLAFNPQSRLRLGLSGTAMPINIFNYGSLGRLGSPFCAALSKRSFSQFAGEVTIKTEGIGVKDGARKSHLPFRFGKKNRNLYKALAASKRNTMPNQVTGESCPNSKTLASKDADIVILKDQCTGNDNKGVEVTGLSSSVGANEQNSEAKGKTKQRVRRKKSKAPTVEANTTSGAIDQLKSSEKASQPKPTSTKNEQSRVEITSPTDAPEEVLDGNISKKNESKLKTLSARRKRKSSKDVNTILGTSDGLPPSSDNQSLLNEKSLASSNTKPFGKRSFLQLYPPRAKSVVVVESLTKAKVIQEYLGDMFEVLPSYGHVRDLAARSGSVRPDDDFSMVWEVPSAAWTHLKSIKVALSGVENLILASDPDREGEAIAWHIIEMLYQQGALREDVTVARVVFSQITESSIKSALQAPREIDENLVHAYLARRALDYLIGFNISPLLWRKLPGCQSAGRVQSAALSLICDREKEIDEFKPQEYWSVEVDFDKDGFSSPCSSSFSSHLTHFDSKKLNQLSISSRLEANSVKEKIYLSKFMVLGMKRNKMRRNPPTPYITSTLQQDAANKLDFSATYTMKLAQKLYEGVQLSNGKATGLITYMRTDGLHVSDEAAKDIQSFVIERYGQDFASKNARTYFKKVKNAQEAHEAIRPTDIRRLPSVLVGILDEDSLRLYTLIWSRTMACQMEPAIIDQVQVDIGNAAQSIIFRSTCSRVEFLGYRAVNEDTEFNSLKSDENEDNGQDDGFKDLSSLESGESLNLAKVELGQHFTQPPPRYSEGSLVKRLEELGIGRPSTYATTIKVLKDRNYVTVKSRILYPEFRGRMVSTFLSHYFSEVTDFSFTADMETELDNVSAGLTEWKGLLKDYWTRFSKYCQHAGNVHIHQVEKMLEKTFEEFLFASFPDRSRTCPSCSEGTLIFKVSRFGAGYFIGCDQHPKCKYIAKTLYGEDDEDITPDNNKTVEEPKVLGANPGSNEKVLLKNGPYGYYVQLGEDRKGYIPKRASVSQIKDVSSITLQDALELLRYPVTLGNHPEDDQPVVLKLAKMGFSIRHRRSIAPVPKNLKASDITLEKALELLKGKDVKKCGRPKKKKPELEEVEAF